MLRGEGWGINPQAFSIGSEGGGFTNLLVLNKKIKGCLGWDENPPTGHVVSCKKLRDWGLHTFKGMIGYCMKDNVCWPRTQLTKQLEYVMFRKIGLNNQVSLS